MAGALEGCAAVSGRPLERAEDDRFSGSARKIQVDMIAGVADWDPIVYANCERFKD
jgi:hypothetical protein